jgi:hypothetical protein
LHGQDGAGEQDNPRTHHNAKGAQDGTWVGGHCRPGDVRPELQWIANRALADHAADCHTAAAD